MGWVSIWAKLTIDLNLLCTSLRQLCAPNVACYAWLAHCSKLEATSKTTLLVCFGGPNLLHQCDRFIDASREHCCSIFSVLPLNSQPCAPSGITTSFLLRWTQFSYCTSPAKLSRWSLILFIPFTPVMVISERESLNWQESGLIPGPEIIMEIKQWSNRICARPRYSHMAFFIQIYPSLGWCLLNCGKTKCILGKLILFTTMKWSPSSVLPTIPSGAGSCSSWNFGDLSDLHLVQELGARCNPRLQFNYLIMSYVLQNGRW